MSLDGEWHFYNCTMGDDDARVHVFVRTDLYDQAPDANLGQALLITITLHSQRDDGLTDHPETEALWDLEQCLAAKLNDTWDGVYVGRYTRGGRRTMMFYLGKEPDRLVLANIVSSCAPEYLYEAETYEDVDWEGYLDSLYPNDIAWLEIRNQPVLDRLIEAGDPLEPERHTLHWLYFETESNRNGFVRALKSKGGKFDVVEPLVPDDDFPMFGVRLEHNCGMTPGALINAQLPLIRLAEEFDGEYDGFECAQLGTE